MPRSAATKKTAPKMLTREIVLALRRKICGIGRTASGARREGNSRRGAGRSANFCELTPFGRCARGYFVKDFTYYADPLGLSPSPGAFSGTYDRPIRYR